MKNGLDFFFEIPADLPSQFSISGQIFFALKITYLTQIAVAAWAVVKKHLPYVIKFIFQKC